MTILYIHKHGGDFFATLILDSRVQGIWRGEAFRWVCEAFKPLVLANKMDIAFSEPAAEAMWDQTASQVISGWAKQP